MMWCYAVVLCRTVFAKILVVLCFIVVFYRTPDVGVARIQLVLVGANNVGGGGGGVEILILIGYGCNKSNHLKEGVTDAYLAFYVIKLVVYFSNMFLYHFFENQSGTLSINTRKGINRFSFSLSSHNGFLLYASQ